MAILSKPRKTATQKETLRAYWPIVLLSYIGKVLEHIIADRLSEAAEAHSLLLDKQFRNRKERSIEAAVKFVVQVVRAAWRTGGTASL